MKIKSFVCFLFLVTGMMALADNPREKILFDEDGNRIFENLQARMEAAAPAERIPVLIRFRDDTPPEPALRLANVVKNPHLKYSYKNLPVVAASMTRGEIQAALKDAQIEHVELDGVVRKTMSTASSAFG